MNKGLKLFSFILIFFFSLIIPRLNADQDAAFFDPEKTISMDFQDAKLKDILKIFSIQSGLNFIASEDVQNRSTTLYLDNVPIKDAMNKIFKANNLTYELDRASNIFIVKDWGKLPIETVTRVFYLKYATVSSSSLKEEMSAIKNMQAIGEVQGGSEEAGAQGGEGKWGIEEDSGITKAVKKLLTENGSVIEDYRTNSLVVTDIPSRIPVITQVILSLDVPAPQILIEVEMLDVSKAATDKLGFKYGSSPFTLVFTGASRTTNFPFGKFARGAAGTVTPGSIAVDTGTNSYSVTMDFLRTQTDTKYLARPRILTLNNETAEIKIVTNESVGVKTTTEASTSTTSAEPERSETGVSLRVTPQVNLETGEITMYLNPKVAEATAGNTITSGGLDYKFRDPEERTTRATVRVRDGDTIIMGGLIRNEYSNTETKVPFFGDIPLIGSAFRHKNKDKDKGRELLVFITPHIIWDSNAAELTRPGKVDLPDREQNAMPGINRQLAIKSSLNSFEGKKQ